MNNSWFEQHAQDFVHIGPPVWNDAASQMKIDIAVDKDSNVWAIHDQPFPDYLEWIEFDTATQSMTFITANGKLQNLGLTIHAPMDRYVAEAKKICVVLMRDGQIRDLGLVPLTVNQVGLGPRKKPM